MSEKKIAPAELNDEELNMVAGGKAGDENQGEYKRCLRCGETAWFAISADQKTMKCSNCGAVIKRIAVY